MSLALTISPDIAAATPVTVFFQNGVDGYSGAQDTRLASGSPGTNYGTDNILLVDGSPDLSALFYWDITGIPSGSTIMSVDITINVIDPSSNSYEIYDVLVPWVDTEATWNEYAAGQSWQVAGASGTADRGGAALGAIIGSTTGEHTFTLNAAGVQVVQSWLDNSSLNYGLVVQNYTNSNGLDFYSQEGATPTTRPRLSVTYEPPALAVLSINDVTVTEGNSGTVNAGFTVTLSGASAQVVTVNYATANGTATAGSDYVAASGQLTFQPGETTKPVTIVVNGDVVDEPNENFMVNLTTPVNATIVDAQGVGAITDDDPASGPNIIDVPGDYSTIQAAINAAPDGSEIIVAPGTYTGALTLPAKSLVLASWYRTTGDTSYVSQTVINGNGGNAITIESSVGYTIQIIGLTIENANDGILARADFDISHCRVRNTNDGIDYSSGSGGTCMFNIFENNNDDGIDCDQAVDVVIENNLIRNNGDDGIEIRLQPYTGSTLNIIIRNNEIYGNQEDGIQLISYDSPTNRFFLIERNLIYNNAMAGFGCMSGAVSNETYEGASLPERIHLFNNTFSGNNHGFTGGDNVAAVNNIFTNHPAIAMKNVDGGSIVSYSIFSNNGTNFVGTNHDVAHILLSDPLLDSQFNLQEFSPAIDAGTAQFTFQSETILNIPASDYNGAAPDLGAIESEFTLLPPLSINDVTVTEGNSGTVAANFTVTLAEASTQTVTVNYATADGTAIAGSDYNAASGQLSFSPGQISKFVTVQVSGDQIDEPDETFVVSLSNAVNAAIADGQGVCTIIDNESTPVLSINNVSVTEGDAGTTAANFTVSLSGASSQTVTADYATADGSASAGADYIAASGQVNLQPGQTSATLAIQIMGDNIEEPSETFLVDLSNVVNATIGDGQGQGTIIDDDAVLAPVTVSFQDGVNGYSGTRDTKLLSSAATTNYGSNTTMEVDGEPDQSTLLYWDLSGIPAGSPVQSVSITVNVLDASSNNYDLYEVKRAWVESQATWNVYATGQSWGTAGASGSADHGSTSLGVLSGSTGSVTASLNAAGITMVQSWVDNPATNYGFIVQNYTSATNGFNFSSRETSTVASRPKLTVTYLGAVAPSPSLSINDVTVTEGNSGTTAANFTVNLSPAAGQTVTVNYATANGTASAGSDYVAVSGQLSFLAGETAKTVTVQVNGDLIDEANETFVVNLSNAVYAAITDGQGAGTITDDDGGPLLSINDVSVNEGNSGTVNAAFTVTLSATSTQTVTVNYATANGTATAGADYAAASGQVTLSPGQTTQQVTVVVNGDVTDEPDETFVVNLSNPVNATIGDGQGQGTIVDDDAGGAPVTVSFQDGVNGYSGTRDTKLQSSAVTSNYGTNVDLEADGSPTKSTLLYWDVSSIPAGSQVQSVAITVNVTSATTDSYEIYDLKRPWVESQATWNVYATGQNWEIAGATGSGDRGSTALGAMSGAAGSLTVNLNSAGVAMVQAWVNTPGSNFGFIVQDYTSASDRFIFSSREVATVASRPKLTITYLGGGSQSPILSINNVTVTEGNSGTTAANFTISLSPAASQTITVNYATANGTATAGSDYVATSGQLSFSAGQTSKTVAVQVNGDVTDEPNETFVVNLSNAVNATIADNQGTGTITDDEGLPALSINDVTVTEGNSGATAASFTVTLAGTSAQTVTVNYATADSTATIANNDYVAASGQVSFAPGETTKPVTITVNGDAVVESTEFFLVNLTNAVNAILNDNKGVGAITNDDGQQQVVTVSLQHGTSGYTGARDTKLLSSATTTNYGTAAKLELDGTPGASSLLYWDVSSIPAGSSVQSVEMTVNIVNSSGDPYNIYEMLRPWVENEATWNIYAAGQSWQVAGGDGSNDRGAVVLGAITGNAGLATFQLNTAGVALVQAWVANAANNHGFIVLNYNAGNGLDFSSKEFATVTSRPKLTITYSTILAKGLAGITDEEQVPDELSLRDTYPNPFNMETRIEYGLPNDMNVHLAVYNLLGRHIRLLVDEHQTAGNKTITWNGRDDFGRDVGSGVYLIQLVTGGNRLYKKMTLIK